MNDELMTLPQAADFLQISKVQLYKLINRKQNPLPIFKMAEKTRRVYKSALLDWMDKTCPVCSTEMDRSMENNGFSEPEGESHLEPTGKYICHKCGYQR